MSRVVRGGLHGQSGGDRPPSDPPAPPRRNRGIVTLTDQAPAAPREGTPAAHSVDLRKTYGSGDAIVHALAGVNVTFQRGRFTAVMGRSRSGKSTLMHCMAGLDRASSGQVFVGDMELGRLDDTGLTQMRRDRIGFVFQSFNLVPTLTAAENITLPADLAGRKVDAEWFDFLVDQLGIRDRLSLHPISSSLTSRRVTSTRTRPRRCWASSVARSASSASRS